jgi:hypothetical protein
MLKCTSKEFSFSHRYEYLIARILLFKQCYIFFTSTQETNMNKRSPHSMKMAIFRGGETAMNGFNRNRLMPALATSIMLAGAILAPLPSIHASGNVYADPAHPLSFIHVNSPATLIDTSTSTTTSTINVETNYRCSPSTPNGYITPGDISVTLVQPTGVGTGTAHETAVICDNHEHDASVTVTTMKSTPPLSVGEASVIATLSNKNDFIPHTIVARTTGDINLK